VERLLQRCLDYDPHERPSAKEVVEILTCAQLAQMKCLLFFNIAFAPNKRPYAVKNCITWLLLPGLPHPQPSLTFLACK